MQFISSLERRGPWAMLVGVGVGVFCVVALAQAATTISTNINTAGTLNADGATTLGSTLGVTGLSTLAGFISTASSSISSTLDIAGDTTLASTTATSFKVGSSATRHTGFLSGYCTIAAGSHTASTTKQFTCSGATGVTTSDRVFVQATSSMPSMFVVQSATSSTDAIEVRVLHTGLGTTTAGGLSGPTSLNFWAVR